MKGLDDVAAADGGGPDAQTASRPRWRGGRIVRVFAWAVALPAIVAMFGFVGFASSIAVMKPPAAIPQADAIIVLTGGHARIETGLDLLRQGRARRMLISGVHPDTSEESIRKITGGDRALFDCCIDLDRAALNTEGNAAETSKWVRANGFRRVIVVTNNYHMPRSLLEFSRAMDGVRLTAFPVVNTDISQLKWLGSADAMRVLSAEYAKYAAARLRSIVAPEPKRVLASRRDGQDTATASAH